MVFRLSVLGVLWMIPFVCFAQTGDLSLVGKRIVEQSYLRAPVSENEKAAEQFADALLPEGCWSDINYTDKRRSGWEPTQHIHRIAAMSDAFSNPESRLYGSEKLKHVIATALTYWNREQLICPNWWYNEIGIPKILGVALLAMSPHLDESLRRAGIAYMHNAKIRMTGQNRVWLSFNVLMTAILEGNDSLAEEAIGSIKSEIKISDKEGIQSDCSFHQHGAQPQFGNYGLGFVTSMSEIGTLLVGTEYAFSGVQLTILRDFIVQGMSRVVRNGYFDVSSCGRQLAPASQQAKAEAYGKVLRNMAALDGAHKKCYDQLYRYNIEGKGAEILGGYRHFDRSEVSLFRNKSWMATLKMSSERIIAAEKVNGENLRGDYLSDGALMLYRDGDEYVDLFPVWKWRMVPGVTALYRNNGQVEAKNEVYKLIKNHNRLSGGVSADGCGLSAMNIDKEGFKVNKSWFFTEDYIFCIGSGLTSGADPVKTAVNQTLQKGDYSISEQKGIYSCLHNHIRYNFHDGIRPEIECGKQSGQWREIITTYQGTETVEKEVFGLYINHGNNLQNKTFVYSIEPNADRRSQKALTNVKVIRVSEAVHVVKHIRDGSAIYQVVLFRPMTDVDVEGLFVISSSAPAVILVQEEALDRTMNVAGLTPEIPRVEITKKHRSI